MPHSQSRFLIPIEVAAVAAVAVIIAWVIAAPGTAPGWEQSVFTWVNQGPDWLLSILWAPMQLGAVVGAMIVVIGFFLAGKRVCAATYGAASLAGWLVAVVVKEIVGRGRPFSAGVETIVRGVDATGLGFISGHTTVAFAGATVIWVFYGRRWGTGAYALAAIGRNRQDVRRRPSPTRRAGRRRGRNHRRIPRDVAGAAMAQTSDERSGR